MSVTEWSGWGGLCKAQQVHTPLQPGAEGLHPSSGRDLVHTAPGRQWDTNLCLHSPHCPLTCAVVPQRVPAALYQLPHPLLWDFQVFVTVAHLGKERGEMVR